MKKNILLILLIIALPGCDKKDKSGLSKILFQNKSFTLSNENKRENLIIEFKDSTYQIFGNRWEENIPWKITNYNGIDLLILGTNVIGIKQVNKDSFECEGISLSGNKFILSERKIKWDKDLIFGIWIRKENEKIYDYALKDSVLKPKLPPVPDGYSKQDFEPCPYYVVTKDSIKLYQTFYTFKSQIDINNTSEYILMALENPVLNQKEWQWKIIQLDADSMILEKKTWTPAGIKYLNDTLIRKSKSISNHN